jgi:hypothetical protein
VNWWKAFGVSRYGIERAVEVGADQVRVTKRSPAAIRKQITTCRERGYKPPPKRWLKAGWKQWQLAGMEHAAGLAHRNGSAAPAKTSSGTCGSHERILHKPDRAHPIFAGASSPAVPPLRKWPSRRNCSTTS